MSGSIDNDDIKREFLELMQAVPKVVDFAMEHAKDARWDVVARAVKVLEEDYKKRK